MIIKSKSYKSKKSISNLVYYVMRDIDKENDVLFTKFIRGDKQDSENIIRQYRHNEIHNRQILRINSNRMLSREEFKRVKLDLEQYQLKFPEIKFSSIEHDKVKKKNKQNL